MKKMRESGEEGWQYEHNAMVTEYETVIMKPIILCTNQNAIIKAGRG